MQPYITAIIFLFMVNVFSQQQERPDRGSIQFGTDSPPIKIQQDMGPFRYAFVRIAESLIPSVVSVIPTLIDTGNQFPSQQQDRKVHGLGSGFIVSNKGYILTNYHVIAGAQQIEVLLSTGSFIPAEIVGIDSLSDIAVLKLIGKLPNLSPVYLGNSDSLKPGDWVAAIGNPFALTSTVTSGIISALGRQVVEPLTFQNFIQIDAAINPGNSGGPLVNLQGAVVGINTLIVSETGGFMGVGFAIPINLARRVMEDLIYEGRVIRGYVGISIQEITPELQEALGLKSTQGALVADVIPQQPAARAGIRIGDVIISIADKKIEDANTLLSVISGIRPGEKTSISLLRNGKHLQFTVIPIESTPEILQKLQPSYRQPRPQRDKVDNKLGIGVRDITNDLRDRLNIPKDITGVMVTKISPDIIDERAYLLPGHIIVKVKTSVINWTNIKSSDDFKKFADSVKNGQAVALQVIRGSQTFFVSFRVNQ